METKEETLHARKNFIDRVVNETGMGSISARDKIIMLICFRISEEQTAHLTAVNAKQAELIDMQGMFISYLRRYSGETSKRIQFVESISKIQSELQELAALQAREETETICTCSYHRPNCDCNGACRECGKRINLYQTAKSELTKKA